MRCEFGKPSPQEGGLLHKCVCILLGLTSYRSKLVIRFLSKVRTYHIVVYLGLLTPSSNAHSTFFPG